ncbi:MAG: M42 family metallopeptidase [Anaerolineae bacterium]|nr:M42 family metallopeptidase [Anaerolineae bacterium]
MYLEQLSNAFGVSSAEDEVRKIIIEAARPHADEWRVDTMGNLFVTRQRCSGAASSLRVMVTAHMDEVGFIISKITDKGLLKFEPVGSFNPAVLLGKAVVVGRERIPGVIGLKPIHLLSGDEEQKVPGIASLYIDIGATDSEANGKVKVGDFATFATKFGRLGGQARPRQNRGLVRGKALDNRAGCAVLLELLKGDYPVDLMAVFTVQEEVGARGARVASYTANPNLAFVVECTAADDLPPLDESALDGFPCLGQGPAITVMDRSFMADRRLVDLLVATAEAEGLPYQFKRPGVGGTDGGAIHLAREGVPSVAVSMAARYIHSPAAVLDLADFWNTVKLMQAVLKQLPKQEW